MTPWLLAAPSAAATIGRRRARWVLGIVGVLLLLSLGTGSAPNPNGGSPGSGGTDVALYGGIVAAMRHGADYYAVAADALRAGGYPLRPFVAFRLPTLAAASGALPAWAPPMLLAMLALAVALAWWERLAPALRLPARVAAALLLLAGVAADFQQPLWLFHEAWAGLLVALSLARWRRGRAVEVVGWGLAAALIRETAALTLVLMAAAAWRDGDRREAGLWAVAIGILAVVVGAHAWAVSRVVGPLDPASPGWGGLLGLGFALRSTAASTALAVIPVVLAAPLLLLGIVGWWGWRDPLGRRAAATLVAYAALLAVFARADNFYWALMLAPLSLAGLVFVPDAGRDLVRAALDTRRITVRRVTR